MQAWNSVKVINEESLHHTRFGTVTRVEKRGNVELIQVRLDGQGEPGEENYKPVESDPFDRSELELRS